MKERVKSAGQEWDGITLIGPGNWGTALASALFAVGIPIDEIVVRKLRDGNRRLAQKYGARLETLKSAKLDAEIIWICTPDAAIAKTAAALAKQGLLEKGQVVLHSSGVLASTELAAVRDAGASVASVHPLMSFPQRVGARDKTVSLRGVPFAMEGDARAVRMARRVVRALGGDAYTIRTQDKPLYHAFGAFASPLVTALLTAAVKTGCAAGISQADAIRRMQPIVERTVANFFAHGPRKSLSGPVARGDVATVERHLAALLQHQELLEIYRALQNFSVESLPGKNKKALRKMLAGEDGSKGWEPTSEDPDVGHPGFSLPHSSRGKA